MNYCLKTDQYKYQIILNFSNGSETTTEKSPDFIFKTSSPALKNTPFVKSCKNEHNADDWFGFRNQN